MAMTSRITFTIFFSGENLKYVYTVRNLYIVIILQLHEYASILVACRRASSIVWRVLQ